MNATSLQNLTGLRSVLVVDDDPDMAALICAIIRQLSPNVHVADVRGGREAIEYLRRRGPHAGTPRPDAILLDLEMPEMSGLEVLGILASAADLRDIPVAMFTGLDDDDMRRLALQAGACEYALKPVDPTLLAAVLGETIAHCLAVGKEARP
ncbi:MAG: response regulator [Planctomycetota bacterium]